MSDEEPKIVGFLCNWCSYVGADLAGTSRIEYSPNIKIIRVMCSGSVDSIYVLRALFEGADAILIAGCHPGDCHYVDGNYKARRKFVLLKSILGTLGLEDERIWLRWVSASEGKKFAETVTEINDDCKARGPNPIPKYWNI